MRLLNTSTLKLESFVQDIPDYVILSHTWGDGEVTVEDIDKPYVRYMPGYEKILKCCRQANLDGFEYAWIDTCCIDKRSSSELSEAINSMYRWYWNAAICYAYLSDVRAEECTLESISKFEQSRWFMRGWTLQELLAPTVVNFFSVDWRYIGTKLSLMDSIHRATGIDRSYLRDRETINKASMARKFSWASTRETTREEDMAYCLLGLLSVSMPLTYGEGKKAFVQLQLELLKETNDHTIFAWALEPGCRDSHGLLCDSPLPYRNSGNTCTLNISHGSRHEITNRGMSINLPCLPHSLIPNWVLAVLNCRFEDPQREPMSWDSVGIWLKQIDQNRYWRIEKIKLERVNNIQLRKAQRRDMYVVDGPGVDLEAITSMVTCGMRIIRLPASHTGFSLDRVSGGSYGISGLTPVMRTSELPQVHSVENKEYVALHLSKKDQRVVIVVGQKRHRMWVHVSTDVPENRMKEVLEEAYTNTMDDSPFFRDTVTQRLQNGWIVSVRGKKRRFKRAIFWDLEIDVRKLSLL